MRVRFDDDEMNLTPEISQALGYQPGDQPRRRTRPVHHAVAPHARREESSGRAAALTRIGAFSGPGASVPGPALVYGRERCSLLEAVDLTLAL